MHIVLVSPEYPTLGRYEGGLANYLRKAGWGLAERGHEVSVLTSSETSRTGSDGPVRIVGVPRPSASIRSVWGVGPAMYQLWMAGKFASGVSRLHRNHPVDVVLTSNYQASGLLVSRHLDVPTVCRISSYAPLLRAASGLHRSFATHLTDYLEFRQVTLADKAFAPSRFMAEVYERFEGLPISVVHTPVEDVGAWISIEGPPAGLEDDYVVFFGTLNRVKGIDLVASVLPDLFDRYPMLRLVTIGRDDGLPGIGSSVEYLRERAGPHADRIRSFPPLPRSQWVPLVACAVAVVMPSRVDNYPNACIEAQSLGVPVIGSYDSSIEEIVEHGRSGLLIANDDATALGDAIRTILDLPAPRHDSMRRAARDVASRSAREDRIGALEDFLRATIQDSTRGT